MPGLDRRTFLALGGGAAAAAALAACGGNTGRAPSGGSSSAGASGGASGSSKPALTSWFHQYGEEGTTQALQKYGRAYPNATVTTTVYPGNYDQKSASALLTNGGPDVFEYGNGPTIDMIQQKQVVDLTDLLGSTKSDFNPQLLNRMTWQGKVYGIPQVTDMILIMYRPSMLKAKGITPPTTWADLVSAAVKLSDKKVKGFFAGNDAGAGILAGPILWGAGTDFLTSSNQPGFLTPDVLTGFKTLRQLYTSGGLLQAAQKDWSEPDALIGGQVAMQATGAWNVPKFKEALKDDFAVMPFPKTVASGKPVVTLGAYGSSVNAKSKNVEAAKAYVKWLWVDNTADQTDFATAYGFHIPARTSVATAASKLSSGVGADAVKLLKQYGHVQNQMLWSPKCQTAFSDMATKIIKNGADPASAAKAAASVATAEVKRITG